MSSAVLSRFLAPVLLAVALACGAAALSKAASLEDLLAGQLIASGSPALLEPITSAGRKGWDCKPEHAAGTQHWRAAGLPTGPEAP
ncbi:MAG: hypothetical protein ABI231_03575 [Candidatus Tumulicola sp.]